VAPRGGPADTLTSGNTRRGSGPPAVNASEDWSRRNKFGRPLRVRSGSWQRLSADFNGPSRIPGDASRLPQARAAPATIRRLNARHVERRPQYFRCCRDHRLPAVDLALQGLRCASRAETGKWSCSEFGRRAFARYSLATAFALLKRRFGACKRAYEALKERRRRRRDAGRPGCFRDCGSRVVDGAAECGCQEVGTSIAEHACSNVSACDCSL
jgi:hypothetical protein